MIVAIDPSVPTITWTWVPDQRSRIRELAGFQVILEDPREVAISFDLDPLTTSLAVPAEFLNRARRTGSTSWPSRRTETAR